jgi:FixJ family two-component response regulator
MPGMSGKELADRVGELRPNVRSVFMSGYTGDMISRNGILEQGMILLEKPFNAETLLETLETALTTDVD